MSCRFIQATLSSDACKGLNYEHSFDATIVYRFFDLSLYLVMHLIINWKILNWNRLSFISGVFQTRPMNSGGYQDLWPVCQDWASETERLYSRSCHEPPPRRYLIYLLGFKCSLPFQNIVQWWWNEDLLWESDGRNAFKSAFGQLGVYTRVLLVKRQKLLHGMWVSCSWRSIVTCCRLLSLTSSWTQKTKPRVQSHYGFHKLASYRRAFKYTILLLVHVSNVSEMIVEIYQQVLKNVIESNKNLEVHVTIVEYGPPGA